MLVKHGPESHGDVDEEHQEHQFLGKPIGVHGFSTSKFTLQNRDE